MQRDVMAYDVVIVGAGPAGLATAIQIKQLSKMHDMNLSVLILEKGSSVGANLISGCVIDPKSLNELIPNWRSLNFPLKTCVADEKLVWLNKTTSFKLPCPRAWSNSGNYIISLGKLCIRLAEYAEELGVEIYPGFAVVDTIIENDQVVGVITGDMGLDKNSKETANYQMGMEIRARQVVLSEGCRGSITKQIIHRFRLEQNCSPQTFGLGIKEIWQVDKTKHREGYVLHSIGYPLTEHAYGGGFMYHLDENLVAIGLVAALDYKNPYLSPYDEFQKFKLHPEIRSVLEGGKRLEYGARSVVEGGIQALPKLSFRGGVIVGDAAGFINVPKIKGVHNALKSGMLAADSVLKAIRQNKAEATDYDKNLRNSWLYTDLYKVRNIRPAFKLGLYFGLLYSAFEYYILQNKAPWTFTWKAKDNERLQHKAKFKPLNYAKADGVITFDKASSIFLSNISHDDNQPCHLKLTDSHVPININLINYASPETRYCPSGVYEVIGHIADKRLIINSQNCIHCKACDIKDPLQNINWVPPEGGSGPQYSEM